MLRDRKDFRKSIFLCVDGVYDERGKKAQIEDGKLRLNP
jgi:hypothetical protein